MKVIRDQIGQPARELVHWLLTACIVARRPVAESALGGRIVDDGFRRPGIDPSTESSRQERKKLRDMQLAYDVGQVLRTDSRFTWTGTGWTTTLLRQVNDASTAQSHRSSSASREPGARDTSEGRSDQNILNQSTPARPTGRRRASEQTESQARSRKRAAAKKRRR
jgi:hypothetical protein